MKQHPEDALMAAYCNGDDAAFTELHPLARSLVYWLARARGLNRDDADDVTSEVLLRVVAKRHTFEAGRAFRPWVRRIARNRIADLWRVRQRHPEALSGPTGVREDEEDEEDFVSLFVSRESNPLEAAIVAEDVSRAKGFMERLTSEQSGALWRHCCGEQLREVAAERHCPISTVRWQANFARERIRRLMHVA